MDDGGVMYDVRRLKGRLFLLLLLAAAGSTRVWCQAPPTTTVSDAVYRADGTPAGGTLLISWPTFTTAGGQAVAAGSTSASLGAGGALSVALVPNAGSAPAGTVYTVVYQLDDGTVKTEFWSVPTNSPVDLASVRTALGGSAAAASFASRQYVDSAVADRASDTAVVHKAGSETIDGIKQFSTPPSVPAPVLSGDVANKAYVDAAVAVGGGGSFVSKAGDTMTGPLTLSGDPTAAEHAATRHYVDTGLLAKADLSGGLVPPGELGSGTADGTLCLKGNSVWGACGTSSDAVSIQSVPVASIAPSDNQVITYNATSGQYEPKAGGGVRAGMQAVKYATDLAWSQTAAADLSTAGAKTVSLTACPAGVSGTEAQYYVYIAGTGTAEAVQVTGGTCAGNGQPGTLQFTTLNAHPAGYTIGSASSGLQEAIIAARITPSNPSAPPQAGKVIVPPGELKVYARVSIRSSNVTIDFSGSIVECYVNDVCIFVGDPSSSTAFKNVTLVDPRGRATVANGQAPFIETNAQKTRIFNLSTRTPVSGGTFGTLVQVDDDQAFLLDGLDTTIGGTSVRCDATVCNPVVYAPGPFNTFSAVGWLKNLGLSLNCHGNGVDWASGNSLRISDSVIQGYPQYGVRAGTRRGGFAGFTLDNVYEEVGSCTNPIGNIGEAGVIAQGSGTAGFRVQGSILPAGKVPQFANTGATDYRYFVVAQHASFGASNPLYAGNALTNGSGNITVTTPDIAGASTFDLLRVTWPGGREQAPFGTGDYAVVTGVSRASACTNGVCTFTDTQAALQSYTVATPTYFPFLDFWPGNLVLSAGGDSNSVTAPAKGFLDNVVTNIVSVLGPVAPSIFAQRCPAQSKYTPIWISCEGAEPPSVLPDQTATILAVKPNNDGGLRLNLKGRLNFATLGTGPGHIITLSDSNFAKTIATANNRPTNDANDAFIGYDRGNGAAANIGISLGAPVSISNYIGNVGDGTNWLERLTSNLKEFKTNVQVDGNLTVTGTIQGNAVSANQFSVAPAQCNGSFATGIQANGNANCSTADLIQLAEMTPPNGIPNYGLFWFDSGCHCPKVISNNGQAVQLGLTNVFNTDANTLEEYNGTNPQMFNVYGTRTDSSNWERVGLGYDAANSFYVLDVEKAGTGTQRGLAVKLQGAVRWGFDSSFNFKPLSDNNRDLGASTLRVRDLYLGRNLIMSSTASTYNGRATAGPGLVALYGAPVSSTGNTAAISSATLCSTAACPAGQYVVDYYVDSTVACTTAGPAAVSITLGWTDETSAKTLQAPLAGTGVSGGNALGLGSTSNFGSGSFSVWSAGTAAITYSTSYTACTTGTGTYAVRMAVRQVQ